MATDKYESVSILIDGVFQLEITSAEINMDGGHQEVDTIPKGFAGITEGSGRCTITGGQAVPKGGLEFDFLSAIANVTPHEVEFTIGSQSYASNGFFFSGGVSQSSNANTEANWEWRGSKAALI